MTNRCVSRTHGHPAAHHLLVCPSCSLHHLTTVSKRYFSSASSLISQLSNLTFPTLNFFSCPSPTPFPPLQYLFRKCWPLVAPKRPPPGWMRLCDTHCFPAVLMYGASVVRGASAPGQDPLCPVLHKHRAKSRSWPPPTMCLEGSTHNNAAPRHARYYL